MRSRRCCTCWSARSPGTDSCLIVAQVATALILVLAANTSFADFPRLSSFLARDGFLPRQFAFRGERLAFTTGIIALAAMAIALLIFFQASVSGLIPLYTLGVFIAFTLSQSGMFVRWYQRREEAGCAACSSTAWAPSPPGWSWWWSESATSSRERGW